jgi:BirA family biotin operon repressor/biotin-[acetyl-CoA-carboxylase] ligase
LKLDIDRVRFQFPGRRIDWHETVGSTMLEAGRLAAAGCESGTVVGAEEQTAGQGRYGRHWHSEPYAGLYQSIVLRYSLPASAMPALTLALGLAVAEAILKATDLVCDLRWPNDLLLSGKKCCGILTQADGSTAIAGIGLNVNHASFPAPVCEVATSLRIVGGRVYSREQLLVHILRSVDAYGALLDEQGAQPIIEMFSRASSYVAGRRVTVEQDGVVLEGVTDGLNADGFLILREDNGKRTVILAGGVRPA